MALTYTSMKVEEVGLELREFVAESIYGYLAKDAYYLSAQINGSASREAAEAKKALDQGIDVSWPLVLRDYSGKIVVIASEGDTPVGLVIYHIGPYISRVYPLLNLKESTMHVDVFWIAEAYRKHKYGTELWGYITKSVSGKASYFQCHLNAFNREGLSFSRRVCRGKVLEDWYTHKDVFGRGEFNGAIYAGFQLRDNTSLCSLIRTHLKHQLTNDRASLPISAASMSPAEYTDAYLKYLTNSTASIFVIGSEGVVVVECIDTTQFVQLTPIVSDKFWRHEGKYTLHTIATTASKMSPRITRTALISPDHALIETISSCGLGCYYHTIGHRL